MDRYIWPLKIAAKIVLARLPVPYKFWKKLGLFELGQMNSSEYALKVFGVHATKAFPEGLPENFTFLELGPGDSIASALVARARGAGEIILADVGSYADKDVRTYKAMARHMKKLGFPAPDIENAGTFDEILSRCNARYLTGGLESLRSLAGGSVDFITSHSVLEHVRKANFDATMRELARIAKPAGRVSHSIDFKDHLAYSLNNLRFPEAVWESDFFANSGFYTNRLRPSEVASRMKAAHLDTLHFDAGKWPELPLPRRKMAEPFRSMSDDDLIIRSVHVVLRSRYAEMKTREAA